MQLIVTALGIEARIWIERFCMRFVSQKGRVRLYRGQEHALVITGTGKVASAVGTAWALSQLEGIRQAINIGLCGSSSRRLDLGQVCAVSRVIDAAFLRETVLDHITYHALPLKPLVTCDKPQLQGRLDAFLMNYGTILVDMEMAGFLHAAQMFLPSHGISGVKIVSDHLQGPLTKEDTVSFMENAVEACESFLSSMRPLTDLEDTWIQEDDLSILKNISDCLHLTKTQTHQLKEWSCYHLLREASKNLCDLKCLIPFTKVKAATKQERNRHLEAIKHALLS